MMYLLKITKQHTTIQKQFDTSSTSSHRTLPSSFCVCPALHKQLHHFVIVSICCQMQSRIIHGIPQLHQLVWIVLDRGAKILNALDVF